MKGKEPQSRPLAAGGRYGKVFHCRSSQGNSTIVITDFLFAHAGICGPAAASAKTIPYILQHQPPLTASCGANITQGTRGWTHVTHLTVGGAHTGCGWGGGSAGGVDCVCRTEGRARRKEGQRLLCDPARRHPRAPKPPLERISPPLAWDVRAMARAVVLLCIGPDTIVNRDNLGDPLAQLTKVGDGSVVREGKARECTCVGMTIPYFTV